MTVTSHSHDEDFHLVVSSAGPCAAVAGLFPLLIRFLFLEITQIRGMLETGSRWPYQRFMQCDICLHFLEKSGSDLEGERLISQG